MSLNIAMWSGPRNISTAMMYSFGSRSDCEVWDEPFYAFALKERGNDHPLRDEIISAYETRYEAVVARCLAPPPNGSRLFYQKHMTHHMLPGFDRRWILKIANAFLIRDPARVLASYARKWEMVSLRNIGILEQWELFKLVADAKGSPPVVIDADDVLRQPHLALRQLCRALKIDFLETMLSWPPGPKPYDGVWGRHWYNAVHTSTGFDRPAEAPIEPLPAGLQRIAEAAAPVYRQLHAYRLATSKEANVRP
jgi:hypothetical protein